MTPDSVRADYRRAIAQSGEDVQIRRYTGTGSDRGYAEVTVKARVVGYAAEELVAGLVQGERRVILLAEDIEPTIPLPLERGDALVVRGRQLTIMAPDDSTRRIGGELIAYELRVQG